MSSSTVEVAHPFEQQRRFLTGLAYRMLGSFASAEDIVQEAYLRWQAADAPPAPEALRRYLGTIVTRLCLDELKSARARRESYVGPWLPEPLPPSAAGLPPPVEPPDAESLSLAFLVLLESLSPLERAVYLLHDVFEYAHGEVAEILGRDAAACRQTLHRARAHVDERRARFRASEEEHGRLLLAFMQACAGGNLEELKALLTADVVSLSDGGGRVPAATRVLAGPHTVARLFAGLARKTSPEISFELVPINGQLGVCLREAGHIHSLFTIAVDPAEAATGEARIAAVYVLRNPEKLGRW